MDNKIIRLGIKSSKPINANQATSACDIHLEDVDTGAKVVGVRKIEFSVDAQGALEAKAYFYPFAIDLLSVETKVIESKEEVEKYKTPMAEYTVVNEIGNPNKKFIK